MSTGIYWLASYPKSGNTWFRAFLQNLRKNDAAPLEINALGTGVIASSRGWIDEILCFDSADFDADALDLLRPAVYSWTAHHLPEVGYHKIHDAYTFLPNGQPLVPHDGTLGALYILRNPLDISISFANHMSCSIDQAIKRMAQPKLAFSAQPDRLQSQVRQHLLSWSQHVLSWVDAPELHLEIVRYEDMQSCPLATFTRATEFLGLPSEREQVEQAIRFSDIRELKRQEAQNGFHETPLGVSSFFRRGIVGQWRETLTTSQIERIVTDHGTVMERFGYLDTHGEPIEGV